MTIIIVLFVLVERLAVSEWAAALDRVVVAIWIDPLKNIQRLACGHRRQAATERLDAAAALRRLLQLAHKPQELLAARAEALARLEDERVVAAGAQRGVAQEGDLRARKEGGVGPASCGASQALVEWGSWLSDLHAGVIAVEMSVLLQLVNNVA